MLANGAVTWATGPAMGTAAATGTGAAMGAAAAMGAGTGAGAGFDCKGHSTMMAGVG